MKAHAILLAFLMFGLNAYAQPKNAFCLIPTQRNAGVMSVIDTTRLRVWYAFNADSIQDIKTYIDMQRLEIGRHTTKYYSEFIFRSDSLMAEWLKAHPKAQSRPRFLGEGGKEKDRWSEYQYSDHFISNGEITVYSTMPKGMGGYNSYYKEPYPLQQWQMGTEIQTILGYKCQKAVCHWRGRDFVAWFAPGIPVKAGPWKFGGLPGLILKLNDMENLYRFEAVRISTKEAPISKYDFKNYQSSSRDKVWKWHKVFNENFYKAAGLRSMTFDAQGKAIIGEPISKFTPYEPLEKE